uniref:Uncharacterized protein n=1 Tax=Panagrolaimus sp. ES5 TaxID=591445 RepID=A0AC34FZT0_9BILA
MNSLSKTTTLELFHFGRKECEASEKQIDSRATNSSTLSLHIAAYENSVEALDFTTFTESFHKNINKVLFSREISCVQKLNGLSLPPNPFEIPRQQEDRAKEPEIMKFKSSQRLLNPNKLDNTTQEPQIITDAFLTNALDSLNKNLNGKKEKQKISSRKRPPTSNSPNVILEKKPKLDFRIVHDQVSDILEKAAPANPLLLENIRLQNIVQEKEDVIENLRKQLDDLSILPKKQTRSSTKTFLQLSESRKRKIIQIEVERLQSLYGDAAPEIISKIHSRFDDNEIPTFSPGLTNHIFHACNITTNKARKLRHEFRIHGAPSFLASERQISEEKKRIRAGIEFEEMYVKLKVKAGTQPETKLVTTMKNPEIYIQQRLQNIMNNGLYREIIHKGVKEDWFALTIDKADRRSILGLIIGNTLKKVNSPYNFIFLGIFEADDSLFNIYAAFGNIFKILGNIKTITLNTPEGDTVTMPVRWFYIADFKSEKSVYGIKSGNPKYPSIQCLSTTKESYGELDFSKKCPPRPAGFNSELSQECPSIAPFIPPSQFIPPPLHMTLVVHRCCKNSDLSCPHCSPFNPTIASGRKHLSEEYDLIHQRIAEIIIESEEKELKFRQDAQKLEAGVLTKKLEKVLERHGGSRKAFFQAYSGAHLIKMGNNLEKIINDLPPEIKNDAKVTVILQAIKLFFE